MARVISYCVLLLLAVANCLAAEVAVDYARVTGYTNATELPRNTPKVLWKFKSTKVENADGTSYMVGLSEPVVAGNALFFGDDLGRLTSLKIEDGTTRWVTDTKLRISKKPAVDETAVCFTSKAGMFAAQRETGMILWQRNFDGGASEGHPLPIGSRVYVSAYDGHAYAIDKATGEVEWKQNIAKDPPPDPSGFDRERANFPDTAARPRGAASDGRMFIQSIFDQSRVVAVDCLSGKQMWSFQSRGWIGPAPTIDGGNVFIGSQDEHMYCLNKDSGQVVWKFKTGSRISSRAAVHDESIIFPSCDGWLYRVSIMSGNLVWKFQTSPAKKKRASVYSFPLVTDQLVYFAAGEGQIYAVGVKTGELAWKMRPSEHSELYSDLATDGKRLFVTSRQDDGKGECAIIALGT